MATAINEFARRVARRWLAIVNLLLALYAGIPWLAPFLMRSGASGAARVVYAIYSMLCHQMAQRSFFLFGRQLMYSLPDLQQIWPGSANAVDLRMIVGNAEMGWKVAWSDRMVAMYGAAVGFGLLFALVRRRLPPAPIWLGLLLLMPMALDGGTHFLSDLGGLQQGFRATNDWLAQLTIYRLPPSVYGGDALGSFNSWMRLVTGGLFGLAVVWMAYPRLDRLFAQWQPVRSGAEKKGTEVDANHEILDSGDGAAGPGHAAERMPVTSNQPRGSRARSDNCAGSAYFDADASPL